MKKVLAVVLAVMMLFSVIAIGVAAVETTTGVAEDGGETVKLPEWLTELIARLKQVIAKLLFKLGIKISWAEMLAA